MIWNPFKADKEIQKLKAENHRLTLRTCGSCEWTNATLYKTAKELHESKAVNLILKEQIEKLYQEKMDLYKENDQLAQKLREII